ncbi:NDR1/HIN1-like protein 13 [Vigna radiata var. radiata]|uniref:NDR1/HIN1-like protein 13 n=1 Tax=Vigna radiata var. radiata TaxID=3916 RepID=A0A1S3U235_VIGRR|nr:NDR1/HIN1-like protein 13 [Vigna radiata var. radiata]
MTDRVYPSAKPAAAAANPAFPATKAQLYGATRPTYRPQPHHRRRSKRGCCCTFCFWLILTVLVLLLLIGIAGTVFYLLYRPHRPTFTVTSLKLSYLNLTASSTLNSRFDVTVSATNPNKKILFAYDPTSISILSGDVDVGDGTVPAFLHGKKNTTLIKTSIVSTGSALQSDDASRLKSSMKNKNGLPLKVNLETKVKAKMGKLKTPKVRIRVSCDGIRVNLPSGKKPATASTSNAKCNVDVRFKIWKWTV